MHLKKIAELENIHPSDEDVEKEFEKLAENYQMEIDKVKTFIPKEELAKDIAVQKSIDLVRENAVITEGKKDAE